MSYTSSYERINWQNTPSVATPINASNLNKMDAAIKALDKAMGDVSKSSRLFSMSVQSVASNKITAYMGDTSIGEAGDLIMLNMLDNSGTTSASWSLYLTEPTPGGISKTFALKNVDGSAAYTEAVDAGAIMFVMITGTNTANVVGVINAANIDFPLSINKGGTGNTVGFIQTGLRTGTTVGTNATIEGSDNAVTGNYSHADGYMNTVSGSCATASGRYNNAGHDYQAVVGQFNDNKSDTLLEVGNGTGNSARSNALEVYSNGHVKDGLGNDMESLSALEQRVSGNPIIVNAQDVAAKGLKVRLEPIQSGTGDPSPTNIRPISGRTEVRVDDHGKNLFDGVFKIGENIANDGTIVTNNKCAYTLHSISSKGTLTVSTARAVSNIYLAEYDANNAFIRRNASDSNVSIYTVNLSNNCAYILISFNYDGNTIVTQSIADSLKLQIEHGSLATEYTPYVTPSSLTIPLGQTVYGTDVNWDTGVATLFGIFKQITWGSLGKTVIGNYTRGSVAIESAADYAVYPPTEGRPQLSNLAPYKAAFSEDSLHFYISTDRIQVFLPNDTDNSTVIQLYYELATPTTVQLTPAQLKLLKGYNYITGDGIIDLVYVPESITGQAEGMFVPISMLGTNESGNTKASRAYTAGEYFYKDKKMYRVTANIAQGAAFTVNTNCVETTLFAELKAAQN